MKKKKKEKLYVFVDSENVGNLIPESVEKNMRIYFFFSDVNILKTIAPLIPEKHFETFNINEGEELQKNEMDLCIVARLSALLYKLSRKKALKKARFVILSNDKGYDQAISILKKAFKTDGIERAGMSLRKYLENTPDPYEEIPVCKGELPKDKQLRKKAKKYRAWPCFKKSLTAAQKKAIRIDYAFNRAGAPVWFEYDFYSSQYVLMYSGSVAGRFATREEGSKEYSRLMAKTKTGSQQTKNQRPKETGAEEAAKPAPVKKRTPKRAARTRCSRKNRSIPLPAPAAVLSEPALLDEFPPEMMN